jgi:hypothetical protein
VVNNYQEHFEINEDIQKIERYTPERHMENYPAHESGLLPHQLYKLQTDQNRQQRYPAQDVKIPVLLKG